MKADTIAAELASEDLEAFEPSTSPCTTEVIRRQRRCAPVFSEEVEAQLIAALTSPSVAGETCLEGGLRRERDVAQILTGLDQMNAYLLSRRLQCNRADDPLVIAFVRIVFERRRRLIAVLENRRRSLAGR